MAKQDARTGTFVVRILDRQNATWQGTVSWTEKDETQPFRSALELIRLMDSALSGSEAEEKAK